VDLVSKFGKQDFAILAKRNFLPTNQHYISSGP
jgi:hypothetical protein